MTTIDRVENGWVIHDCFPRCYVVEEIDVDTDAFTTQKLLWTLLDVLGLRGSKHDSVRVQVRVVDQAGLEVGP